MANWRRDSSTTSLTGMLLTLRRMRTRRGQQRLRDLFRRQRHMLGLRMVKERVLERHQQNELDGEDDRNITREGWAAHPQGQPLAPAHAESATAIEGYGHDRSTT